MRTSSLAVIFLASTISAAAETPSRSRRTPASLEVTSSAFTNNGVIPSEHTCDGADLAPPLSWSTVPAGTKSIAILFDDLDGPTGKFTHWLVTGIPPTTSSLDKDATLPRGAFASTNDKGTVGYAGPCPPAGRHRYELRVYALDIPLPMGMTRADLVNAVTDHILATGRLVGTYQKQAGR
jgi:Raf kinase inhibitor-like YbhB/YbcL family protein